VNLLSTISESNIIIGGGGSSAANNSIRTLEFVQSGSAAVSLYGTSDTNSLFTVCEPYSIMFFYFLM
jgi:hypothetical protein